MRVFFKIKIVVAYLVLGAYVLCMNILYINSGSAKQSRCSGNSLCQNILCFSNAVTSCLP